MDIREKLVELLTAYFGCDPMYFGVDANDLADFLVTHGVTVQEWIPVTERLPDTEDVFLCWSKDLADMMFCYTSDFKQMEVTHWMQLPQPPKGE